MLNPRTSAICFVASPWAARSSTSCSRGVGVLTPSMFFGGWKFSSGYIPRANPNSPTATVREFGVRNHILGTNEGQKRGPSPRKSIPAQSPVGRPSLSSLTRRGEERATSSNKFLKSSNNTKASSTSSDHGDSGSIFE